MVVRAVFTSAHRALRAAVDLLAHCAAAATPLLPLRAGIGLYVGEPSPSPRATIAVRCSTWPAACARRPDRGRCSPAETVISLARRVEGLAYAARGDLLLKGAAPAGPYLAGARRLAGGSGQRPAARVCPAHAGRGGAAVPLTRLVGREHEEAAVVAAAATPRRAAGDLDRAGRGGEDPPGPAGRRRARRRLRQRPGQRQPGGVAGQRPVSSPPSARPSGCGRAGVCHCGERLTAHLRDQEPCCCWTTSSS